MSHIDLTSRSSSNANNRGNQYVQPTDGSNSTPGGGMTSGMDHENKEEEKLLDTKNGTPQTPNLQQNATRATITNKNAKWLIGLLVIFSLLTIINTILIIILFSVTNTNKQCCQSNYGVAANELTFLPTTNPTDLPSKLPSNMPTLMPTTDPIPNPSRMPTNRPTTNPSDIPSNIPSGRPTTMPTNVPTTRMSNSESYQVGDYKYSALSYNHGKWLLCDGSEVLRSEYSKLFLIYGSIYGTPTPTTFNLPDFRGKVPGAISTTYPASTAIGSYQTSLTLNNIPTHYHFVSNGGDAQGYYSSSRPYLARSVYNSAGTGLLTNENFEYQLRATASGPNYFRSSSVGTDSSFSIMQPTLFGGHVFVFAG